MKGSEVGCSQQLCVYRKREGFGRQQKAGSLGLTVSSLRQGSQKDAAAEPLTQERQ